MNPIVYNAATLVGAGLVTSGAGLIWGLGASLLACGVVVLINTALVLAVTR